MWRDNDGTQLSLNTEAFHPDRYRVDHPDPRDFNLEIRSVRTDDAGVYQCRIGPSPLITKTVRLTVEGNFAYKMEFMFTE